MNDIQKRNDVKLDSFVAVTIAVFIHYILSDQGLETADPSKSNSIEHYIVSHEVIKR